MLTHSVVEIHLSKRVHALASCVLLAVRMTVQDHWRTTLMTPPGPILVAKYFQRLHGLMVMTFASHAKGSEFDPRCEYLRLGLGDRSQMLANYVSILR